MPFSRWECKKYDDEWEPPGGRWFRDCGKWKVYAPLGDEGKARPFVVWSRYGPREMFSLSRRYQYRFTSAENAMRAVERSLAFYEENKERFRWAQPPEGGISPDA